MSSEEKLMPCECGGDAVLCKSSDGEVEYARCLSCHKDGPPSYSTHGAITAWNTRPAREEVSGETLGWAKATAWHKYGIAWHHLEQVSRDELLAEALSALLDGEAQ